MRYNNYHKHTHQSNISTPDSIIKPKDIAKRAKEMGHTILSTVEHGYGGNILEYYDVATEFGLKFVFGAEMYYVPDRTSKDKSNTHIILLAANHGGMKQINKLISESSKTGFYYKNRIDMELLQTLNPLDIVVTTACVGSYIGLTDANYEEDFVLPLLNHFKKNFYLEVQNNNHPVQKHYNSLILELYKKYNIPLIHGCDSHYLLPQDEKDRSIFLQGKNIHYDEEDGFILDYPDYITAFDRYGEQGVLNEQQAIEALKNTLIIDDFEDIKLDKKTVKMPSVCKNEDPNQVLKGIINEEWKKEKKEVSKNRHQEYIERIRYEIDIVEKTNMAEYFVLNYKIVKRAKELGGVLTKTGRGSAPSFYINKLLGFTEIDAIDAPIPLYPTRFMSVSRILETGSLADIDFNTAHPEPFIQASKEILGEDGVYLMITYGTMKDSEAFRNLCRSKNMKMEEYNEVAKNLDIYRESSKWKELIKESEKFVGVIDSCSEHPCAVLLLDKPISEEFGLFKTKESLVAIVDSYNSDTWKYLKNDFLTVTVWEIIAKTYELIGKPIPSIRELTRLLDDKVWKLYKDGMTTTLNQTGTESGISQIIQYKPKSIAELSAWVAAIRPGFQSMREVFLNRDEFSYGIPEFDKLLENSGNFCLYQEDVMSALIFTGFEEDVSYGILKQIAKKRGDMSGIKDQFINGFIEKTGSKKNAEKVWTILEDNVKYSFNSSHSLSVALDSLYGAYLKAHYSIEYFTTILNVYEGDTDTTSRIFKELPYFGLGVNPIQFGKSRARYSIDKDHGTIVKGLASIKYMNGKVAEELFELSKNEYDSFLDLLIDIREKTSVNSKQLQILVKLNFFSLFGNNQKLLDFIDVFNLFHNKKQIKKGKIDELQSKHPNITHNLLQQYSRETDKSYLDFQDKDFLTHLWEIDTGNEKLQLREQLKAEVDYLGYAQTTMSVGEEYHFVKSVDAKYAPKIMTYRIKDGYEKLYKMQKPKYYTREGVMFESGDIIKIKETIEKNKIRKTEDGFEDIEGQFDTWIESYSVIRPKETNVK